MSALYLIDEPQQAGDRAQPEERPTPAKRCSPAGRRRPTCSCTPCGRARLHGSASTTPRSPRAIPRIVYAYAPGYRPDGPYRDRPAYDDVIQGESGIAAMCGAAFGEPRYVPTAMADKFCGHVLAGGSAWRSSPRAHRRGTGSRGADAGDDDSPSTCSTICGAPMFDPPMGGFGYNRLLTPLRRPFATSDGHMCIMASNDDQWRRLLIALDLAQLADDPRFAKLVNRAANIEELYRIVTGQLDQDDHGGMGSVLLRGRHSACAGAAAAGDGRGSLSAGDRVLPSLRAPEPRADDGNWQSGPVLQDTADVALTSAQTVGEHTEAILRRMGIDPREVAESRDRRSRAEHEVKTWPCSEGDRLQLERCQAGRPRGRLPVAQSRASAGASRHSRLPERTALSLGDGFTRADVSLRSARHGRAWRNRLLRAPGQSHAVDQPRVEEFLQQLPLCLRRRLFGRRRDGWLDPWAPACQPADGKRLLARLAGELLPEIEAWSG